jgi:hypothetical protein
MDGEKKILSAFPPAYPLWAVFKDKEKLITVPVIAICLVELMDEETDEPFTQLRPYCLWEGDADIADPTDCVNFEAFSRKENVCAKDMA